MDVRESVGARRQRSPQWVVPLALPSWDAYVSTALDDVIAVRGRSPLVRDRMVALLDDLERRARPERRPALAARARDIRESA